VVSGITPEKVARFEGWGQSRTLDFRGAIIDRLTQLEGKLSVTIEHTKAPMIDVTSSKNGG
jgi:hypothetical protein